MLHALLDYARETGLKAEAGFKPKRVRWLLQFSPSGQFRGLVPASGERGGRQFEGVPHLQFTGDTPMRQFLVDTAQYAVMYGQNEPSKKLLVKHGFFLQCLRDAAGVEPVLGQIATALEDANVRATIHSSLDEQSPKAKPSDNLTFVEVTEKETRILVEKTTWHDWWRGYWPVLFERKAKEKASVAMRCFLSGDLIEPAKTHPKIKGLGDVGGNIETTLVGFNLDAFTSYGLKQSANAATSTDLAEIYAAAMNRLIEHQSRRLAGSKVAHWYTHDVEPQDDPLKLLFDPLGYNDELGGVDDDDDQGVDESHVRQATDRARELVDAIRAGHRPDLENSHYRAVTLSGNAGRAVVEDWMEGQFPDLAANVDSWFKDFEIVHRNGHGLAPRPKFAAILWAMVRDIKEVPKPLERSLWRAAVNGLPIPYEAMSRAMLRARVEFMDDDVPPNHARMGLLKAYIIRNLEIPMQAERSELKDEPAYICGKIMAILARIQHTALGDVGAGVVQRYYAAASATPALVLGRLVRLAQTGHLPKIKPGLRSWHDMQLAGAWESVQSRLPTTLTLEQQTLFAMGYYHQKADIVKPSSDPETTDEAE